ncbi:MAG: hypothetical protein C0601_01040 [Candidatus Muiribacterium halophilum]|uniref:ATPase n=1 Tax=Muiribacterium halophilum TaxID=2053465 RepID=A0A2N5ZM71_MUIH1|nr:MAG: hypothetical protein C0601_01040 [Candidatus Muirbacterium halophilum]
MFEDILNEIKAAEEKAQQEINSAREQKAQKIRKLKEDFEKEISSLHDYEKAISEKAFSEQTKNGEEEARSISGEYTDQMQNIRISAEKKMDKALDNVLKGI